jgi:hypothetical protein
MAVVQTINGDVLVRGALQVTSTLTMGDGSISDAQISPTAAIAVTKLQHIHRKSYAQPNTASTTETRAIHVVHGATGTISGFKAGSIAKAVGDSTVTLDLKKNGTTCLSSVITLNSSNTNRVSVPGTLSVTSLATGDLLEVVITATAGTGTLPTGVYCSLDLVEDPE